MDDDPGMLRALSTLLDAHGFEINAFASARDWLDHGAFMRCDCVLLDVDLGDMSGADLQQHLRASGSKVPVIFMTALDEDTIAALALETASVACLRKPFAARELIDAIERASI